MMHIIRRGSDVPFDTGSDIKSVESTLLDQGYLKIRPVLGVSTTFRRNLISESFL
jgi:hypothetical protein